MTRTEPLREAFTSSGIFNADFDAAEAWDRIFPLPSPRTMRILARLTPAPAAPAWCPFCTKVSVA